jgi:hypothetical protein
MPKSVFSPSPAPRVPNYRRHKPTGQAVVTLNGRDIYLGKWNTKESRTEYDRIIGEWLAAGRSLPKPESDLTVAELGSLACMASMSNSRPANSCSSARPSSGVSGCNGNSVYRNSIWFAARNRSVRTVQR